MNSSALFIRVALSMEFLIPMSQFGCAAAWAGVTTAISLRDAVRNGPPDAVIVSFSRDLPSPSAWKMPLCSESTGSTRAPVRAASERISFPPQTMLSLLAIATSVPCRTAASVDASPADPTIAASTRSQGRVAASMIASSPPAVSMPVPARRSLRSASLLSSAMTAMSGRNSIAWRASVSESPPAASATISNGVSPATLACATTSSADVPIEPVEPMMEMRR